MFWKLRKIKNRGIIIKIYLCQKCQTLNITLINTMWQAEKCNLLWKDSVSARSRIKCDRFQRSMTYSLRALVSLSSHFDRIKEKKNIFRRQIELQQKESSARLEYSNMSACSSRSAFEKRGDPTGWRARWNLHLRECPQNVFYVSPMSNG